MTRACCRSLGRRAPHRPCDYGIDAPRPGRTDAQIHAPTHPLARAHPCGVIDVIAHVHARALTRAYSRRGMRNHSYDNRGFRAQPCTHKHTGARTCTQTHSHKCTHGHALHTFETRTRTRMHTDTHNHTQNHTHTHTHNHTHTHTQSHTHTHTHTITHTHTHTQSHTRTRARTYQQVRMHSAAQRRRLSLPCGVFAFAPVAGTRRSIMPLAK